MKFIPKLKTLFMQLVCAFSSYLCLEKCITAEGMNTLHQHYLCAEERVVRQISRRIIM